MRIPRIDQILVLCETHLVSTGTLYTEIDTLLAFGVLVRVYAEFEQMVDATIEEKSLSIDCINFRAVFNKIVDDNFRGILYGRLIEFFEAFGDHYTTDFRKRGSDNPRAVTFYSNIMTHRRDTAHRTEPGLTFADVKRFYEEGHVVLDFFRESLLSIDPTQPTA